LILENPEALASFRSEGIRAAKAVLEKTDPSITSNLYATIDKALAELRTISMVEITALRDGEFF
jgi:hypothetical protein